MVEKLHINLTTHLTKLPVSRPPTNLSIIRYLSIQLARVLPQMHVHHAIPQPLYNSTRICTKLLINTILP